MKFAHADTTASSLQGAYEFDEDTLADEGEAQPITLTYGHSKDHRPDLKQAILSLICARQSSIPVYLNALSGNSADKVSVPETVQAYQDAQQALHHFSQQWAFHEVTGEVGSRERHARAGRSTADSPTITEWVIQATAAQDDAAIVSKQQTSGKYIIATNELDATRLSSEELLTLYKGQNTSVERGFRFLKDPLFFAHSLFLKKPTRIMALLMVMGLWPLFYALAEHHLRQQLLEHDQTIPDQKGKPTQCPTLRRVFQMFEGIHVLTIIVGHLRRRIVTNVNALHLQIATLLGAPVLKFYLIAEHPL